MFTAYNVICSVCKRRRIFSFNILQVDNELMLICCNSAAGRTAAPDAPAGFTAAGRSTAAAARLRRRHNNSLITADIYTRAGSRVRVYDLNAVF